MDDLRDVMRGIRCLQQLGGRSSAPAASAAEIARLEGLDRASAREILDRLSEAGFVAPLTPGYYRLNRAPAEIHVADVWSAFGAAPELPHALTLADLIQWETTLFAGESVAEAG